MGEEEDGDLRPLIALLLLSQPPPLPRLRSTRVRASASPGSAVAIRVSFHLQVPCVGVSAASSAEMLMPEIVAFTLPVLVFTTKRPTASKGVGSMWFLQWTTETSPLSGFSDPKFATPE